MGRFLVKVIFSEDDQGREFVSAYTEDRSFNLKFEHKRYLNYTRKYLQDLVRLNPQALKTYNQHEIENLRLFVWVSFPFTFDNESIDFEEVAERQDW